MQQVEQTAKRLGELWRRRVRGVDDGAVKHGLHASARERGALCEQPFLDVSHHHRSERSERDSMWPEHAEARLEREREPVAPPASRHVGRLPRIGV